MHKKNVQKIQKKVLAPEVDNNGTMVFYPNTDITGNVLVGFEFGFADDSSDEDDEDDNALLRKLLAEEERDFLSGLAVPSGEISAEIDGNTFTTP